MNDSTVIFSYTRAQALADGVLVDVTDTAREAGYRHPVALTHAVYESCVRVPQDLAGQDEPGRLWDILWMLRCAIAASRGESELAFKVLVHNDESGPRPVCLKAVCGPGDDGEPVLTVMLPEED